MNMPRIRSIKPEMWQDEKLGSTSIPARLLFVGLITQADDAGRLRGNPALLAGQVFPYDALPARKVDGLLDELACGGLIIRYEANGERFIALTSWAKHQKISHPTASVLPKAPEPLQKLPEDFGDAPEPSEGPPPRARAPVPDPYPSPTPSGETTANGPSSLEVVVEEPQAPVARAHPRARAATPTKPVDQDQLPDGVPDHLHQIADQVTDRLHAVWRQRGGNKPTLRGVGLAILRNPDPDHLSVVGELEHWALAGKGQAQAVKDWARTYATFLARSPAGAPVRTNGNGTAWDQAAARNAELDELGARWDAMHAGSPS